VLKKWEINIQAKTFCATEMIKHNLNLLPILFNHNQTGCISPCLVWYVHFLFLNDHTVTQNPVLSGISNVEKRESRNSLLTTLMHSGEYPCKYVVIHMDPITNCVIYLLLHLHEHCSVLYYCQKPLGLCCYAKLGLVSRKKQVQYKSMTI
jgi:hypothetical protein